MGDLGVILALPGMEGGAVICTGKYSLPSPRRWHGKIPSWWWKRIKGPPYVLILPTLNIQWSL